MAKNYLPLLQQIADSLKKIGLVGTLPQRIKKQRVSAHLLFFTFQIIARVWVIGLGLWAVFPISAKKFKIFSGLFTLNFC